MIRLTRLVFSTIILTLIAGSAADASQLSRGLVAFKRGDYVAAGALLRLPAERGNSEAQAVLCYLHTYGRGVPQSYDEAAFWCHRSADQGNVQGQYQLGLLYNKGHGVPENFVQAYKWLNLAASRASGPKKDFSYRIRDAVATKMSPNQITKGQALAVAWRPIAEQPNSAFVARGCSTAPPCADP
jgi:uncharacterized protein